MERYAVSDINSYILKKMFFYDNYNNFLYFNIIIICMYFYVRSWGYDIFTFFCNLIVVISIILFYYTPTFCLVFKGVIAYT